MIEYDKEYEKMEMVCDNCQESEEFEGGWQDCIDQAKAAGWVLFKDEKGEWHHYCNRSCREFHKHDGGKFH